MSAATNGSPSLLKRQLSLSTLILLVLDPLVILGTLYGIDVFFDMPFGAPYLLLSLVVFSLTFPGKQPESTSPRKLLGEIASNWVLILVVLVFIAYATRSVSAFPIEIIGSWAVAVPLLQFAAHRAVAAMLKRHMAQAGVHRTAVIVGAGELGQKLARGIHGAAFLPISVRGYFDDRNSERLGPLAHGALLGRMSDVAAHVKQHGIDQIYITLPMAQQPRILQLLDELKDTTASIYFSPDIFVTDLIQARMDNINGIPLVAVCETPFFGVNGLIKKLSDMVLSLLILILISPIMLAIAVGVKLSSPGPVLFMQRRYGVDGKQILVYKFRSMTVCEDGEQIRQAMKNDQRITRFGGFLRRTSLDELPQFINVLQGRMSIVGPRPHAIAHNEMYRKLIRGYMIRHKVKPGITGWAQVNGFRGETETLDKMNSRIEYDLAYLRNWSLKLDLNIILRTVLLVVRDKQAY